MSSFIYLDSVIDSGEPIYVRNTSKERGIVVLTLNDGSGKTHREAIPNTRYPVCLSNKATPSMIKNSSSLRQFLDAGALELIPASQAEEELMRDGVKEALAEAYKKIGYKNRDIARMKSSGDEISKNNGIVSITDDSSSAFDAGLNDVSSDIEFESSEEDGPSPRVEAIVEAIASGDLKARQAKNELANLDLTAQDLTFIIGNSVGIVQKFAKEKMAEVTSDGDSHIESL